MFHVHVHRDTLLVSVTEDTKLSFVLVSSVQLFDGLTWWFVNLFPGIWTDLGSFISLFTVTFCLVPFPLWLCAWKSPKFKLLFTLVSSVQFLDGPTWCLLWGSCVSSNIKTFLPWILVWKAQVLFAFKLFGEWPGFFVTMFQSFSTA